MIGARLGLTRALAFREAGRLKPPTTTFRRLASSSQTSRDAAAKATLKKPKMKVDEKVAETASEAAKKTPNLFEGITKNPAKVAENAQKVTNSAENVAQKVAKTPKTLTTTPTSKDSSAAAPQKLPKSAKETPKPSRAVAKTSKTSKPSEESSSVQFKCPRCSYLNESKAAVKHHVVSEHKAQPYCCPFCPEGFSNFAHLNKHIKTQHAGKAPLKEPYERISKKSNFDASESGKLHGLPNEAKTAFNEVVAYPSADLHPIKFDPPSGDIATTEPPKSSLHQFPEPMSSVEKVVVKYGALEGVRVKASALNKLPETEATSIYMKPEVETSVKTVQEETRVYDKIGAAVALSSDTTRMVGAETKGVPFPGMEELSNEKLAERLLILGKGRSAFARQIYPMKAFAVDQLELYADEGSCFLSENVAEENVRLKSRSTYLFEMFPMKSFAVDQIERFAEEKSSFLSENADLGVEQSIRQTRSTYLFEMFPMKAFDLANFSNNLAPLESPKTSAASVKETEAPSVKPNFLENVKNVSFAYLKQFGLFRK